jgi:peptidoglycan hydrolase-like protein with peptidoglycan-binding domain
VNLTDPVAPPVTAEAVRARQEEYVKTVVAGWR